jgi:tRNA threonylcarbamoyladenosine biosynthesis protein TsaB
VILALDTTSEYGSLALARGPEILEVVALHCPEGFAHVLFQHIVALLERHRLRLADIDAYAAASGPGSFTGVRVGLTAVKGMAEAHAKRVVPVSNLLALAFAGRGDLRAPLIDARRGEIYGAVYDASLEPVVAEVVAPLPKFLEMLGNREVTFLATDFTAFGGALAGSPMVTVPRELAAPVAVVAAIAFAQGRALAPEQVDANYLRRSDAELKWKTSL